MGKSVLFTTLDGLLLCCRLDRQFQLYGLDVFLQHKLNQGNEKVESNLSA